MRAIHIWGWVAFSVLWILGVCVFMDPIGAVQRAWLADSQRPAAAERPDGTDFYRPPDEVRDRAITWQQHLSMGQMVDRQFATLQTTALVAMAPPIVALLGLYAISLIWPERPLTLAERTMKLERDQLRLSGYDERTAVYRVPLAHAWWRRLLLQQPTPPPAPRPARRRNRAPQPEPNPEAEPEKFFQRNQDARLNMESEPELDLGPPVKRPAS